MIDTKRNREVYYNTLHISISLKLQRGTWFFQGTVKEHKTHYETKISNNSKAAAARECGGPKFQERIKRRI